MQCGFRISDYFWRAGAIGWFALAAVLENIIDSLFNCSIRTFPISPSAWLSVLLAE
jgi:hypothetical protein